MTEAEAEDKLVRLVDATSDPELTDEDISDLIDLACRPDENGLTRADADWEPSWDLDFAAAEGWLRKAGRAAARFSFAEDGQRFERAQIYAHCVSQAEHYRQRSMGSLSTDSATL